MFAVQRVTLFNRYVTIQRGSASSTTTVAPSDDNGDNLETKVGQNFNENFRENFYANRIRREARDEPVAIIFPASDNDGNDILSVQSVLPDLPQENGIAYIYPDNLNIRENRQTSSVVPESKTTAATTTATPSTTTDTTTTTTTTTELAPNTTTTAVSAETILNDLKERKVDENELAVSHEAVEDGQKDEEEIDERAAGDGDEGEIISVSVSRSMSEAFSVPEVVTGIIDFITSTFAPPATDLPESDSEEVKTETASTTTTTAASAVATSKGDKGRTNIFTGKRQHPFLASKNASVNSSIEQGATTSTTTTSSPVTRKSFFRQKTISDLNESAKKVKNETSEARVEPEKKFNILNRDSRPRFGLLEKKANETETVVEDEEISTEESPKQEEASLKIEENETKEEDRAEELEHSTEPVEQHPIDVNKNEVEDIEVKANNDDSKTSSTAILINQKLRPKFEVPKSLQGKLLEEAVVEKKTVEKEEKSTTPASVQQKLKTPLRQRQNSRFSAPLTTTSKPVVIKSLAPRSRSRVRPDKPVDLSTSPSQTVTRTRPSAPSRSRPVETVKETTTTGAPPAGPTTTEKLTVADVLATLHGEPEPETKTSTLRPHSFKPKHGTASRDKLREKLREHLTVEDHAAALEAGEVFDDDFEPAQGHKEEKPTHKPSLATVAPEVTAPRGSGQSRRVSRPRNNVQQLKPHPEEEQPRSSANQPIITAPRRRQRPQQQQQSGGKVRKENEKSANAPTGGRLLSDADLMTGLGFGKKETEETEFIPTPAAQLIEELEDEIRLEEEEEEKASLDEEKEEAAVQSGPYVPTIEDILKSAIVETNIPIAPEVLELTSIAPTHEPEVTDAPLALPKPEKIAASVPTRTRTHVPARHRLESSGQQPQVQQSRQAAPIESRRVRTRQRVVVSTTQAPDSENINDLAHEDLPQQSRESSVQTSRQVSRVRQPIRNQTSRLASEFPVASKSRTTNVTTRQPVNNNRLRVRGGSPRSTTATTTTESSVPTEILEDDSFTLSSATEAAEEIFVPDYDIGNVLGKLEEFTEEGDSTNTDQQVNPVSAEDEDLKLNAVSADLGEVKVAGNEGAESEQLPVRKFSPRFGEKQRKSVRSKLKSHLFEQSPISTDRPIIISSKPAEEEEEQLEPDFESVSPSEGLRSLPASFFTTTSRFELFSESSFESFLPTQKPQTRIGRSTVGYGGNVVEVTDKPEPFVKLGISEHSVSDEDVTTTTTVATTTTSNETVTSSAATDQSTTVDGKTTDATEANGTTADNETEDDEPVKQQTLPVEVGSRLYKRKKESFFLTKLTEKIASEREEKEKKLLNSFAESHSRITTKLPFDEKEVLPTSGPDESTKRPSSAAAAILSSFNRPRRKFEIGAKDSVKPFVGETTAQKVNETTEQSQVDSSPDLENSTTKSDNVSLLLPTPRPLPKDLKLPFGKKGFKPTLLAFTIEKKNKVENGSQVVGEEASTEGTTVVANETTTSSSLDEFSDNAEDNSKISSLKRKFQFGRKAFGKLINPKGPEVSSSPPPTSSTTSASTSSSSDPNTPAPDDLLTSPELSSKVFK